MALTTFNGKKNILVFISNCQLLILLVYIINEETLSLQEQNILNIFAFNELENQVMKTPMTLRDYMLRKPNRKVLSSLNENEIKLTCFQAVDAKSSLVMTIIAV